MGDWLDEPQWDDEFDGLDEESVWVDAQGKGYRMADITDSHLDNIIAMLERRESACLTYAPQGEMAEYECDREAARLADQLSMFRGEQQWRRAGAAQ